MTRTVVLKFGGAALADVERGLNTVSIIERLLDRRPVVVVSAMKDVTDILEDWLQRAVTTGARLDDEDGPLAVLRRKHAAVVRGFVHAPAIQEDLSKALDYRLNELAGLLGAVAALRECTPKCRDHVLSFGERFSARGLAGILEARGVRARPVDGRDIVRTDGCFGNASVDWEPTRQLVRDRILPMLDEGVVPVVTGFIGADGAGETTTLGRGGSDLTATLLADCLDAEEVVFYKEVAGFLSADPTLVDGGRHIEHMSYDEVAELSFFGAKILHPVAIRPLRAKNIPATLRSFFSPEAPGTRVDGSPPPAGTSSWALTSMKNVALVTVEGVGLVDTPGIAARVFSATAAAGANILMISQSSSERNICFVVPAKELPAAMDSLRGELELDFLKGRVDRVEAREDLAVLCTVGRSLQEHPAMTAEVLAALADEGVEMVLVARGGSPLNLSCVVAMGELRQALAAVHGRLSAYAGRW